MTVVASVYGQFPLQALAGAANFLADSVVLTLHTSSYIPNLDTHVHVSDLTSEVPTGAGYTQGGVTLATKSAGYTAANSWAQAWAASTVYTAGQVVRPATGNGHLYQCVVGGTSGSSGPAFPTARGLDVVDNTVTWSEYGTGVNVFKAANIALAGITGSARYAVISDRTPVGAGNQPLIALVDFGSDQTGSTAFNLTWDSVLGVFILPVG